MNAAPVIVVRLIRRGEASWSTIQPLSDLLVNGAHLAWYPNRSGPVLVENNGMRWPVYINPFVDSEDVQRFNAVRTLFPQNPRAPFMTHVVGAVRDAGVQVNLFLGEDFVISALRREYRMLGYAPDRVIQSTPGAMMGPGAITHPTRAVMEAAYDSWRTMGIAVETCDYSEERPLDWQASVVFHDNRPIQRVPQDQRNRFLTGFTRAVPRVNRPVLIVRSQDVVEESSAED